jgi:hypothetical protein
MTDCMYEIKRYLGKGHSIFNVDFILSHPIKTLQTIKAGTVRPLCRINKKVSYDPTESADDYDKVVESNVHESISLDAFA